jgi:RNA polymerase sigma factor (TIGR02999 family)
MTAAAKSTITRLLRELSAGRPDALGRLIPAVYEDLRRMSRRQLQGERAGHSLDTSALVHETYLKLVQVKKVEWRDREHFFAMAARLMRRILIDHARTRRRRKRGRDFMEVSLGQALDVEVTVADDLLALDEALNRLELRNERHCRVVECRFFGGMSVEETARALGVSVATVKRDWSFSRAWLNRDLAAAHGGGH